MSRPYVQREYNRNVGGLNLISGPQNVRKFEWPDAQNIELDEDGSVKSREGLLKVADLRAYDKDLISWWRFEETGGNRRDNAQGRNHLSIGGAPTTETGKEGSLAIVFDGASDFLTIVDGSQTQLDLTGTDFSINFWIKESAHAATRHILARHNAGGTAGYRIRTVGGLIEAEVYGTGTATEQHTTAIDDGAWHMVTVVYKDSTGALTVYIDGGSAETTTVASSGGWTAFAQDLYIAADRTGTAEFAGSLDDFAIWKKELSAANVTALYAAGVGATATVIDNGNDKKWKGMFQLKPLPSVGPWEVIGVAAGLVLRYEVDDSAFVPIPFPSNHSTYLSDTARHTFWQMFNRVYFGNGVSTDPNFRYGGALDLQLQGIPDTGSDVVSGLSAVIGSGNVEEPKEYAYKIVNVQQSGGGRIVVGRPSDTPSAAIGVVSPNNTIRIGTWPAAPTDPRVTHWGLYRLQSVGATFTATEIADAPDSDYHWIADLPISTTTYDDETTQVSAVATADNIGLYFNFRNFPPSKYRMGTTIKAGTTLLHAGDPDLPEYLYISSPDYPDMSRQDFLQPIGRDDGDPINGLGAIFDALVIFKEDTLFVFINTFDNTIFPYKFAQSHAQVGCLSGYSIANIENRLVWYADQGFMEMVGVDGFGNVRVRKISRRIEPVLKNIQDPEDVIAVYFRRPQKHQYRAAWVDDLGAGDKNVLYPYDPDHVTRDPETSELIGAWPAKWTSAAGRFESLAIVENAATNQDQVWMGAQDGKVYIMDSGVADDGNAIETFLKTKWYDHDYRHLTKRFRELVLTGNTKGGSLTVGWNLDYGNKEGTSRGFALSVPSDDLGSDWGQDDWGQSDWGGPSSVNLTTVRQRLAQATGHHIQFTFSSSILNMNWILHGWQVGAVPIGSHRVRRA